MDNTEKRIFLFIILLLLNTGFSFSPSIEPFYTITNTDPYTHEVDTNITSDNNEYSWQGHYELEPGETIVVKKPVSLLVKWINPFREADIFYSSSDYEYYIGFEDKECYISDQPGISTSTYFKLQNESKVFVDIDHHR